MDDIIGKLYACTFLEQYNYIKMLSTKYELVCIDEIEKFNITENNDLKMFRIFDNLVNNMKKIVCGSNLDKDELIDRLGIRIMSRILGECILFKNKGDVLR